MFAQRSEQKELLDLGSDYYSPEEFSHCQKMLFKISRYLGIFRNTVKLLKRYPQNASLLDVGCGGGLFLLNLSKYFPRMKLIGCDISSEAIALAHQELLLNHKMQAAQNVSFVLQENEKLNLPESSVDIILATMVCHHLSDTDLVDFLRHAILSASHAVILNDLHRHALPYWFYRVVSPVLFNNRLITHDGLISIQRGFTRSEWQNLLQRAGIHRYQIKWCFPFCWRVTLWKN